jgi:hypothetical protein
VRPRPPASSRPALICCYSPRGEVTLDLERSRGDNPPSVGVVSDVERGRELCARRAWAAAYESLSASDPARLSAGDLELLAISAFMSGRDEAYVDAWERA